MAKIPFAPPDGPIEQTWRKMAGVMGETISRKSPFQRRIWAHAGLWPLIRGEDDTGEIVIVDRRLTETRYGKSMMQALPPYGRGKAA